MTRLTTTLAAILLISSAPGLGAQSSMATSRGDISGHTLYWKTLFSPVPAPPYQQVPLSLTAGPTATPVDGLTVTVSAAAGLQFLTQAQGSWVGNFTPGDEVMAANSPIEILFNEDIFAFGANIQTPNFDFFTGSLTAYDMFGNVVGSYTRDGKSTWNKDGSAIFLGIMSDVGFRRLEYSSNGTGIALNQAIFGFATVEEDFIPEDDTFPGDETTPEDLFTDNDLPVTTNPEPATVGLLAAGMLAMGVAYRRKRRS